MKEANKRAQEEAERMWEEMQLAHAAAVPAWQLKWDCQGVEGIAKSRCVAKPTCPRKPKPILVEFATLEDEEEDNEEEAGQDETDM